MAERDRESRTALAAALAIVSLLYFAWLLGVPLLWEVIQPDTHSYWEIARNLADSGRFSADGTNPTARRELLYPAFLSLFIKAGLAPAVLDDAHGAWAVILVQAGLYVAALALCAQAFARPAGARASSLAMVLGAFFLPTAQFAFQLISEGTFMFLLAASFAALDRWLARGGALRGMLAACLIGAMALVKSVMLLFPLVLLGHALFFTRPRRWAVLWVTLLALALPAMWTARNMSEFGRVIVSTTDGGSSLYRGNMALYYQPPSMSDPLVPEPVRQEAARLGPGREDAYFASLAKEFLTQSPAQTLMHLGYKLMVLLVGLPLSASHVALMIVRSAFWAVVLLRFYSLWRGADPVARLALLLASYITAVHTVIFSTPRYMAPVMFLLLPLCVSAAQSLWRGSLGAGAAAARAPAKRQ